MAKPIFIINLPNVVDKTAVANSIKLTYPELHSEYHVILVWKNDLDSPTFQAFNPETIPDIDIEKLKETLENG